MYRCKANSDGDARRRAAQRLDKAGADMIYWVCDNSRQGAWRSTTRQKHYFVATEHGPEPPEGAEEAAEGFGIARQWLFYLAVPNATK